MDTFYTNIFPIIHCIVYLSVLISGVIIGLWVTRLTQRQLAKPITGRFYYHALASSALALMYIGTAVFPAPIGEFLARARFIFLSLIPVMWFYFFLAYTGRERWLGNRGMLLLFVIPVLTMIFALVGPPGSFWVSWHTTPYSFLYAETIQFGGWYYVHTLYSYILYLITLVGFIQQAIISVPPYRSQALLFVFGLLGAGLLSIVVTIDILNPGGLNIAPVVYVFPMTVYGIALHRYNFLRVIPFAYPLVLNQLDESVMILDPEDHILDLNDAAARDLEITRAKSLGHHIFTAVSWLDPLQERFRTKQPMKTTVSFGEPPNDRVYEVRSLPLYQRGERYIGRSIVWQDITERRDADAEREQMIKDLEAYSHTVAHDLKNPLNVIMGLNQLLAYDLANVSPQITRWLQLQSDTSRHMLKIIEDLLKLAQIRSEQALDLSPVNVSETLKWALNALEGLISQTAACIEIPETLPAVYGFDSWIEEVWTNYLSNALKYGGTPPIIRITATVMSDQVRFSVHDNGKGLTPEAQSKLFQQFVRLEPSRAAGAGLGLAITRRIVQRLGGTVGVDSTPGQGSIFHFSLPSAPQLAASSVMPLPSKVYVRYSTSPCEGWAADTEAAPMAPTPPTNSPAPPPASKPAQTAAVV
ncbi:MAG: histidine kinase N-terminal 7TM domain-containing protein [Anaerolineae bacterium]